MDFNKMTKKQSGLLILIVYLFTMAVGTILYGLGVFLIFDPLIVMLIVDIVMNLII